MKFLELFNYLKENQGESGIHIPLFAQFKGGAFTDYEYFIIEKNGVFYYVQNGDGFRRWADTITATAYLKIDYNTKQQLDYSADINDIQDLENYMAKTEKDIAAGKKPLKKTYKQKINLEFIGSKKQSETEYKTIFDRLPMGWREKDVLKDLSKIHVDMLQNDGQYLVFKITNDEGGSFEFETNNLRITA